MKSFEGGRLDIMGVQKTHVKGYEMINYMMGSESEVWEEMEGGAVWCGGVKKSKKDEMKGVQS